MVVAMMATAADEGELVIAGMDPAETFGMLPPEMETASDLFHPRAGAISPEHEIPIFRETDVPITPETFEERPPHDQSGVGNGVLHEDFPLDLFPRPKAVDPFFVGEEATLNRLAGKEPGQAAAKIGSRTDGLFLEREP